MILLTTAWVMQTQCVGDPIDDLWVFGVRFSIRYHYHKAPTCISKGGNCERVGYMRDGTPIYGICSVDGMQLKSCYKSDSKQSIDMVKFMFLNSDC